MAGTHEGTKHKQRLDWQQIQNTLSCQAITVSLTDENNHTVGSCSMAAAHGYKCSVHGQQSVLMQCSGRESDQMRKVQWVDVILWNIVWLSSWFHIQLWHQLPHLDTTTTWMSCASNLVCWGQSQPRYHLQKAGVDSLVGLQLEESWRLQLDWVVGNKSGEVLRQTVT